MLTTEILVQRDVGRFRGLAATGVLYFAGTEECVTLEDPVRELWDTIAQKWVWRKEFKLPARTAIPSGRYEVVIDMSTRFKRLMPHILNVPDFTGIRIHNGGIADHTEGCPLTGRKLNSNNAGIPYLTGSKDDAFPRFMDKLQSAVSLGKVYITFDNGVLK